MKNVDEYIKMSSFLRTESRVFYDRWKRSEDQALLDRVAHNIYWKMDKLAADVDRLAEELLKDG